MLKDITIGQYIPGKSPVHILDPRIKILITALLILVLFLVTRFFGYLLLAFFILGIIGLSRVPMRFVLKGIRPLFFIIILTVVLHFLMTTGGEVLFTIGPLTIWEEGVRRGLFMAARLILLILVTSVLTLTTSPIALTDGIELILKPFSRFGVPAHELAMMMTIALRFIPTLLTETEKIINAQKARGADFESGNIIQRAKSLVPVLVPLFISAFRRAEELALAMEARCYRGGENRTRMKELHLRAGDFVAVGIVTVFGVVVVLI